MVLVRSLVNFYNRKCTYRYSRAVTSDFRHRFPNLKIEVSLRKKEAIAASFAAAPVDRLERYWDSLRMEMIYSQELGLTDSPETTTAASDSLSSTDALALYHRRMVQVRAVCSLLHHSAAFDI